MFFPTDKKIAVDDSSTLVIGNIGGKSGAKVGRTRRGTESRPRRCASDAAPRPQGAATAGGVANGPAGATAKPPLVDTGERIF